jgi:hypothetical protein
MLREGRGKGKPWEIKDAPLKKVKNFGSRSPLSSSNHCRQPQKDMNNDI